MKKYLLGLFLVLGLVAALFGCKKTDAAGTGAQTTDLTRYMNWNIGADPKTLDPCLNGASDGGDVINQTFEGLVREKSGKLYPGIAREWSFSPDGLTLTFRLRESKWSDGTPLTANDFVYSWKRGMNPATASEYSWIWEYTNVVGAFDAVNGGSLDAVGIRAVDDLTLEVKLMTPTDYIVSLLSFYHFMPTKQAAVERGADGTWAKDHGAAVSNGAFMLTSYRIGEGLTLVKNPNYWNAAAVRLAGIEGRFIDAESTAYQAFLANEFDFIPNVPLSEVPRLIAEDDRFFVYPLLGTYYYNFNMNLPMFQDVRVRRAMALAIDREEICETLGAGQVPAAGFVPPGFLDHQGKDFFETAGMYGFATDGSRVAEAQRLLAEAGYPNGQGFPAFSLMYNTSEAHMNVAQLVQEQLRVNLGLEITLENQEWAVFQDTRKAGNYQVARGGWLTDFMDPMGLLSIFTTGNAYNDPKYNNPEYDTLLSQAARTRGQEHFEALYKAQTLLMTDVPVITVYHYADMMFASPKLKGWDRSVLGTADFTGAWLEP